MPRTATDIWNIRVFSMVLKLSSEWMSNKLKSHKNTENKERIENAKDLRKKGKFIKWECHFLDYIQMVNVGCDLMLPLSNSAIYPMHFDPTTRPRSLLPTKFIMLFRFNMFHLLEKSLDALWWEGRQGFFFSFQSDLPKESKKVPFWFPKSLERFISNAQHHG